MCVCHLGLWDGGHKLHDAVGDSLLELEASLLPEEGSEEAHQHSVLEWVLEAKLLLQHDATHPAEHEKTETTRGASEVGAIHKIGRWSIKYRQKKGPLES